MGGGQRVVGQSRKQMMKRVVTDSEGSPELRENRMPGHVPGIGDHRFECRRVVKTSVAVIDDGAGEVQDQERAHHRVPHGQRPPRQIPSQGQHDEAGGVAETSVLFDERLATGPESYRSDVLRIQGERRPPRVQRRSHGDRKPRHDRREHTEAQHEPSGSGHGHGEHVTHRGRRVGPPLGVLGVIPVTVMRHFVMHEVR